VLLRRSRSFKVTDVGTNRKTVCDFLLVINSNWHPMSYRFEVLADCCLILDTLRFRAPLEGRGLKVNVWYSS